MSRGSKLVLTTLLLLAGLLLLVPAALAADPPSASAGLIPADAIGSAGPAPDGRGAGVATPSLGAATMTAAQVAKLVAGDGVDGDALGQAVAVSGDVIAVGAPYHSQGTTPNTGAVYIYSKAGGTWAQTQELVSADATGADMFGASLALAGDTLVVGAPGHAVDSVVCGATYVFRSIGGVWTQQQKLTVPGAGGGWQVGFWVSLDGDQLIAGAPGAYFTGTTSGAGYIYTRSAGLWSQTTELTPAAGTGGPYYGYKVAISGDTAMVGSYAYNNRAGRVWVYTRGAGAWSQTQILDPAVAGEVQLGVSIALVGDSAVIGANAETVGANPWQGAVYVFARTAGVWAQTQKLTVPDGVTWDEFGYRMARSGEALVTSAIGLTPAGWSGKAYVLLRKDGVWELQAQALKPDDLLTSAEFGLSAALDGGTAVVGAPVIGSPAAPGAAYVYSLTDTVTPSVSGGHGTVSPATAQSVPLGGTPTFTFTPEAGYAVDQVLVDGAAVETTGDAYTFAPVYADHSLAVSFYNAAGPATTIQGAPHGWTRKPVKLRFSATPAVDGKPVDFIEYRVAGKDWKQGTGMTVRRQGQTKVQVRATDTRGNVGPTAGVTVRIDGIAPVVTGYGRPLGRVAGTTAFRFKVKDAPAKTVTAILAVTRYHYPVKQYDLGTVKTGSKVTRRVALGLPVGTWSWRIVVRDPAGIRGLCRWRYLDVTP